MLDPGKRCTVMVSFVGLGYTCRQFWNWSQLPHQKVQSNHLQMNFGKLWISKYFWHFVFSVFWGCLKVRQKYDRRLTVLTETLYVKSKLFLRNHIKHICVHRSFHWAFPPSLINIKWKCNLRISALATLAQFFDP